jgi:transposase-like protein
MLSTRPRPWLPPKSVFAGFRFPIEVIVVAVRWYLRVQLNRVGCLSYRDVEELLVERGVEVDHVTVFRWVQRFHPAAGRRRPGLPATRPAIDDASMRRT